MPSETFDTIVVGARCAGAPLATHLARGGQRVLLLDSAKLPSDQPMSTHAIGALGVDWLDALGVGAEVKKLAPPSRGIRVDMVGTQLDIRFRRRPGYCIRRLHLDRLLQEAAVQAGATLRDRTKVVSLLRENGRVVGVETVHEGKRSEQRAHVVVGADGRHSTVAELAGAKEYLGYDWDRFAYWAYWPRPASWPEDLRSLGSLISFDRDEVQRFVFQTDGDLLLLGSNPMNSQLPSWRGRHEEAYLESLRASPLTAPLVLGNAPATPILGLLKARFFFRESAGPGFALVGDAGLHKDPTPGFGITDALRDARNLSQAILSGGGDAALVRYWRQRDVHSVDLFHWAQSMADPAYVNPLNQTIYGLAGRSPELMARLGAQLDREISPFETVPVGTVLRAVLGAVLRGRFGVLPPFFAAGKRNAEIQRIREGFVDALAALPPEPPPATTRSVAA
jgi:menaquinone-9 beta-reductase